MLGRVDEKCHWQGIKGPHNSDQIAQSRNSKLPQFGGNVIKKWECEECLAYFNSTVDITNALPSGCSSWRGSTFKHSGFELLVIAMEESVVDRIQREPVVQLVLLTRRDTQGKS